MPISRAQLYADGIFESLREPLLILDGDLNVKIASKAFYKTFEVTAEETTGRLIYEIGNGQWNNASLRTALTRVLPENKEFDDILIDHDFQNIGPRTMLLNGRQLRDGDGRLPSSSSPSTTSPIAAAPNPSSHNNRNGSRSPSPASATPSSPPTPTPTSPT